MNDTPAITFSAEPEPPASLRFAVNAGPGALLAVAAPVTLVAGLVVPISGRSC